MPEDQLQTAIERRNAVCGEDPAKTLHWQRRVFALLDGEASGVSETPVGQGFSKRVR